MRARLKSMSPGMEFHFFCVRKMADKMNKLLPKNGGEITNRDDRSYAVVLSVRKCA